MFSRPALLLSRRAFTLIEVLVVISIISLLSSVIFVSIQNARATARNSHRVAEVYQTNLAIQSYRLDNPNGALPGTANEVYREGVDPEYDDALGEYVTAGYLPEVPTSPDGGSYIYINQGDDARFMADLEDGSGTYGGLYGGSSNKELRRIESFFSGSYQIVYFNGSYHESYYVSSYVDESSWGYYSLYADENNDSINPLSFVGYGSEDWHFVQDSSVGVGICALRDHPGNIISTGPCPTVASEVSNAVSLWNSNECPNNGSTICDFN